MIESPVRKYQKQKDYQRHKLFRKMKRRRRAQMEQIKDAPMKLFRRKLGLPKFGDGKNGEQEYENSPGSVIYMTPDGAFVNDKGESVNVLNKIGGDNPAMWTFVDEDGKIYTPRMAQDSGTISQGNKHTPLRQLMSKSDRYRYDPLLGAIARLDTKNPFEGILKTGVAQVGPGAALADTYAVLNAINSASDDVAEYNSGKSIHINPANRGKFNALKRRTGKTTEQLTHSKNPLTRKRAIFAQNARKWHHR